MRIPVASRSGALPLSFNEEAVWRLAQEAPQYWLGFNAPMVFRLNGALDVSALQTSLNGVVARHEILRTTFAANGGPPHRVIASSLDVRIAVVDLSDAPRAHREGDMRRRVREQIRAPFDLTRGPLIRATLFKLGAREHVLCVVLHHMIADAWSVGILLRELSALYARALGATAPALAPLTIQYADYAAWLRARLSGATHAALAAEWRTALHGASPLPLPTDSPRPAVAIQPAGYVRFTLGAAAGRSLERVGQRHGATLFTVLLAMYCVVLSRWARATDITVGVPVSLRTRSELAGLVGFLVNTAPYRVDLTGHRSIGDAIERVKRHGLDLHRRVELPFSQVQAGGYHLPTVQDATRQIAFNLVDASHRTIDLCGVSGTAEPYEFPSTPADVGLTVVREDEGFECVLAYKSPIFFASRMERLVGELADLIEHPY